LLAHEVFVHASFFLISAHIAAALYHRKHRDGIWDSMVPLFREPAK
jgi:cytochrome b561